MSDKQDNNPINLHPMHVLGGYAAYLVLTWIGFKALSFFWGEYVLLDFDDLRAHGTSMAKGLAAVWWIFVWAFGVTLLVGIWHRRKPRSNEPGETLLKGTWLSINAGIFEELIFRWLAFFGAMILIPFFDFITFGLEGWLYREVLVPLANWSTFGALEPQLLGHDNWVFGAAIVSASIVFRDEHEYLGFFGWVNSWFLGMVMFWLVFNYGIGTAIVAHVIYDVVVFSTRAATYLWRPESTMANWIRYYSMGKDSEDLRRGLRLYNWD